MEKEIAIKKRGGFKLIELLVVVAIIGLLSSIILVSVIAAKIRARDAKRLADLYQFSKALEMYFNDNKGYPTAPAGGVLLSAANVANMVPNYLNKMPVAPIPPDLPCSDASGKGNNNYWYEGDFTGNNLASAYTITFCLGGTTSNLGPGTHFLSGGALH